MKFWYALVLSLFLIPFCFADDLDVDKINLYINDDNTNFNEEDIDELAPNDKIEIKYYLENLNASYKITSLDIYYIIYDIDDGDDLEDDTSNIDLDPGDRATQSIYFDIPEDVKEDQYDMEVEIKYTINGVIKRLNYTYLLEVDEDAIAKDDLREAFDNFTFMCDQLQNELSILREGDGDTTILSCETERIEKSAQLENANQRITDKDDQIREQGDRISELDTELTSCDEERTLLKDKLEEVEDDYLQETNILRNELDTTKTNQTYFFVGLIGVAIIGFVIWKKKFEPNFGSLKTERTNLPSNSRPRRVDIQSPIPPPIDNYDK